MLIYMYIHAIMYTENFWKGSHSNPCFSGKEIDNEKAGDKRSQ